MKERERERERVRGRKQKRNDIPSTFWGTNWNASGDGGLASYPVPTGGGPIFVRSIVTFSVGGFGDDVAMFAMLVIFRQATWKVSNKLNSTLNVCEHTHYIPLSFIQIFTWSTNLRYNAGLLHNTKLFKWWVATRERRVALFLLSRFFFQEKWTISVYRRWLASQ